MFAELEALVSAEVDAVYGEPTRVEPRVKTTGRYSARIADETRSPLSVTGVVDFDPITLISQDTGKYDGMRPAISGEKIHVSYTRSVFPSWVPQQGDLIVLVDRSTQDLLRISRVDEDRLGRLICVCERAAAEPEEVEP